MEDLVEDNLSPGSLDPLAPLTTSGMDKNTDRNMTKNKQSISKLKILHVKHIPSECDYETIAMTFRTFGNILEIRMRLDEMEQKWEAWITCEKHEVAFNACSNAENIIIYESSIELALTDKTPRNMDVYKPAQWINSKNNTRGNPILQRTPKPPMWLVATAREENYNYFKFCLYIQKKVGGIKSGDISRFGKNTVLIHAKSETQSQMLSLMSVKDSVIKEIKPHHNFSYGRGVVFDKDLYELEEDEILEMSPLSVWQVKKVAKANMVILTFEDANVPSHVVFGNERIRVRPYHLKPLQCFNCFRFGHSSAVCKDDKICHNCSANAHGSCSASPKCANCLLEHKSTDRKCEEYKYEEAAVNKANAEHITTWYAKKLLGKSKSYARALKELASNTTRAPAMSAVPSPVVGTETQVVMTQASGLGAQLAGARAQLSEAALLPPGANVSSSGETLPLHHHRHCQQPAGAPPHEAIHESMETGEVPRPTPPSPSHLVLSQASLPGLGETSYNQELPDSQAVGGISGSDGRKRERPLSLSPKPKNAKISTSNRFDVFSQENFNDIVTHNIKVEMHEHRKTEKEDKRKGKGTSIKPNISRPNLANPTSSNGTHNSKSMDGKTSHKESSIQ